MRRRLCCSPGLPGGSDSKESACKAGDPGLIPRSGRSSGEGNGHPLQHSGLENPHGQGSPVGYSPRGHKGLGTAEPQTLSPSMLLSSHKDLLSLPLTRQTASHLTAFALAVSTAWGSVPRSFSYFIFQLKGHLLK